ncbi:hypothetical protein CPC08DRAFT_217320 [Agrocybe pediades]|nr:hypothetical protein CPC08DRAFT_217320 [Agrocybe pediades]
MTRKKRGIIKLSKIHREICALSPSLMATVRGQADGRGSREHRYKSILPPASFVHRVHNIWLIERTRQLGTGW